MAVPLKICSQDILLNEFSSDVACYTLRVFKSKGISLKQLKEWQAHHDIVYPWDPEYNSLRLCYNRLHQNFPLMLGYVVCRKDVNFFLNLARKYDFPFSLRAGAHDVLNFSTGPGIVIDVSKRDKAHLKDSKIHPTVWVQSGARIGELVKYLSPHGLALPAGTCQNTGVCGLTVAAGIGFLTRKYGFTFDNLLAVTLTLANGESITTNNTTFPDLFWALKGAGAGSFGVLTDFKFKVYPIKRVVLFQISFPRSQMVPVLERWQSWAPHTDPCFTAELDLGKADPVVISGQAEGPLENNLEATEERVHQKLSIFDDLHPIEVKVWITSFADAVRFFATPNPDWFIQARNAFIPEELPRPALEIIQNFINQGRGTLLLTPLRGNVTKIPSESAAFPWRDSLYWILMRTAGKDSTQQPLREQWISEFYTALLPYLINPTFGVPRVYTGFYQFDLQDKYPQAYWGPNVERLQKVKRLYDPDNFFKFPQSVPV